MRRSNRQTARKVSKVLPNHNTSASALSPFNNPLQFSDAPLSPADPRHILAIMTQTRHQCRPGGLIKRDHTELIHIAKTLGLSKTHMNQIIELVQSTTTLSDHQLQTLATIPINPIQKSVQKKTRIPIRVLIGLSIWALTIVIAMQMV